MIVVNCPFQWFTHLQIEPTTSCKYLESKCLYTAKIHPLSYSMRISIAFTPYFIVYVSQLCMESVIYNCYSINKRDWNILSFGYPQNHFNLERKGYLYLNSKHLLNLPYAHHSLEELESIMCFQLSGAP